MKSAWMELEQCELLELNGGDRKDGRSFINWLIDIWKRGK